MSIGYGADDLAITDADLELHAGELVVVLGPNGGGKTTLFKALTSELGLRAGSLKVDGEIAYLPQYDESRADFPVSVIDVVEMGAIRERRFWWSARREIHERATTALEQVGLAELRDENYGELSGGQRRRVLLARTIIQDSEIVILDEPLAGVDPASAEAIQQTLRQLRDSGKLVLVASHSIDDARAADRVLCLNRRIVADGDPALVLTDTALRNTYAADLTVVTGADGLPIFAATEHHHGH